MTMVGIIFCLAGIIWGCAIPPCFLISCAGLAILAMGAHEEKYN